MREVGGRRDGGERGEARGKLTMLVSQFTLAMLGCSVSVYTRNVRMHCLFGVFLRIQLASTIDLP